MAVALILRKFEIKTNYSFLYYDLGSWDLSGDLEDSGIIITRELESDAVFNFAVSYTSITLNNSDTLTTEFTNENLSKYSYGIELSKDGVRKFVGQIEPKSIQYQPDSQRWEFKAKDWYKFCYDVLKNQTWVSGFGTDLSSYLTVTFNLGTIDEGHLIGLGTIDVPPNILTSWDYTQFNINYILSKGLRTRAEFLEEVIKHYGAFLYIDADYKLNFINRSRQTPPIYAHNIDPLDQTMVRTYIRDTLYDGVIVNQLTVINPVLSEVSWRLLRYVDGEIEVTKILSEEQLNSLPAGRVLDIRQNLGGIAYDQYFNPYFVEGIRFGYWLFPQRDLEETLKDYRDLFQSPILLECDIEHNEDAELLSHFFYTHGSGAIEYTIEYIEEDLVQEKMLIRAKQYFNNALPLVNE